MRLQFQNLYYTITFLTAGVAELVDASDSKSDDGNIVWVRVPPSVPAVRVIKSHQPLPLYSSKEIRQALPKKQIKQINSSNQFPPEYLHQLALRGF